MGRGRGQRLCRIARVCALAVVAGTLTACSSANKFGSKSQYSKRVVEEGEPVPKGGGSYKVGQPYQLRGKTYYPNENPNYRAEGIASWYGPDFHGRQTANGETYDMHGISAAHTTMPIPSYARVTNLDNGRSIIVRVNDRGPYVGNRLIDLSIGTAKALDFYSKGLARVRVEYVGRAPLNGSDDKMLLATLREGGPAPAPSRVMIASAKPFLPQPAEEGQGRDRAGVMLPAERPFTLGGQAQGLAAQQRAAQPALAERSKPNASAKLPDGAAREPSPVLARGQAAQPGVGFTASPSQGPAQGSLGLMSGRGLY